MKNKIKNAVDKIEEPWSLFKWINILFAFLMLFLIILVIYMFMTQLVFIYFYEPMGKLKIPLIISFIAFICSSFIIVAIGKRKLFWFTILIMTLFLFIGSITIYFTAPENFLRNASILLSAVFFSIPLMMYYLREIYVGKTN